MFSDVGVENEEWTYLKNVESKLTNVVLTCSKEEKWFADNVSTVANIRLQ